jgi:hypothetical protein
MGASVRVDSTSIARPEAIHQSTTAGGQTQRAPLSLLSALLWPNLKKSITQPQQGNGHTGRLLTALLWPDLKQFISQPQQRKRQKMAPVDSPSMARLKQSITQPQQGTDTKGTSVRVDSPSIAWLKQSITQPFLGDGPTGRLLKALL